MPSPNHLRLFVWHNVLTDYTPGIAFALAFDIAGAKNMIYSKFAADGLDVGNNWLNDSPEIYNLPVGLYLLGGG